MGARPFAPRLRRAVVLLVVCGVPFGTATAQALFTATTTAVSTVVAAARLAFVLVVVSSAALVATIGVVHDTLVGKAGG